MKYVNREIPVLFENHVESKEKGKHSYFGYTPNYLKVNLTSDEILFVENQITNVKLDQYNEQSMQMQASLLK